MAFLHALSPPLLHRDLKSPNVFMASLDEHGLQPMAKVADFGLSTRLYASELRESLKTRAVENPTWLVKIACSLVLLLLFFFVVEGVKVCVFVCLFVCVFDSPGARSAR